MKKFVLGFILGACLFSTLSIYAASTIKEAYFNDELTINLDGKELDVSKITVVEEGQTNGSTYVKLRDVVEPMGGEVGYNGDTKTISINTAGEVETVSGTVETITQTPDGITQIDKWEGQQYIGFIYIRNKIKEKGYDFVQIKSVWKITKNDEIILDNVPTTMIYGASCVEVNYYINTVLPLIQ